jgi:predicted PurR-regulated permease PerM
MSQIARRSLIAVAMAALVAAVAVAIVYSAQALLVVFAGVLLAVLLRASTQALAAHTPLRSRLAFWVVVVVFAAILVGGGWFLAAEASPQFEELGTALTEYWQRLEGNLSPHGWGRQVLSFFTDDVMSARNVDFLSNVVASILAALSTLVIAVFIGLYVGASPERYRNGLLQLVPMERRPRAGEVLDALYDALRGWLTGTLINMTVIGVVTTIGLSLLGVPLPLALGLLAFALEFIPFLGPILAAIPAVLMALTVEPRLAGYTVLLYFAVQQFEEYALVPYVYHRSVHLPPALTIAAQIVLGTLLGILGLIFATPLTACAIVLTRELYVKDVLGDRGADDGHS